MEELRSRVLAISDAVPNAIAAAVNPAALARLLGEWDQTGWPRPRVVNDSTELPLSVHLDAPEQVGIDRLLNAVAGNVLRPAHRSLVIVSSGTATTIDFVSQTGAFEGGAILPGFSLAARALHDYTAFLPLIPAEELAGIPPEPLGRTTRSAMQSGIYWGQVGAVKEMVARLGGTKSVLILTGGGSPILAPHFLSDALFQPELCLQGLALVAGQHRDGSAL